jgi:hypothetical protein
MNSIIKHTLPLNKLPKLKKSERRDNMNNQTHFKSMEKMLGFLFVLLAVLALSSCSSKAQAAGSSCFIDMGMRVTIDVEDVKPQIVIDQLAANPDCAITLSPFILKHVTIHAENATVSEVLAILCPQIRCKWILNENHLTIKPLTIIDKMQVDYWEKRNRILQSRLPEGMVFEDVPLSAVLEEISEACGLTIKAWEDEGDCKVTMDVSGMTVNEALKAVVLYVDGEGAVLIKMGGFNRSYGQHWLWGYPPP